ncbi:MAG: UDP-3-O-(3-hydroxymyristoyl)glucosamine N-acyltransferase [Chlorobium sp.]|jgi:UDP-3-O-[3-hydroxymyristoyl] glucosamine N-acyltransferase|uniref:UDP-3-O-(3-hydroxymyristoyl)glucosamine N-acyltransferase n=1 Tax=Chlorobium sp. TaxID=1095 RepID=UPI001D305B4B|nr:UDP-3-O-(3-hydroxymyristoyl)glucosamine N-acyltransferase [Chlorobium sp.]MBN1279220.1 UDP-3-O-(3-hydroxymyristoyl)glucosamine N-acyltransferase [Chlorobiaceae bacterium]MCF8215697.1 UDP-3-O-(3-hydroxymyristoyl)glucosamine N-acyltransferase [Chlorobium sp.]MCF8270569.1 UDP-3-O-(3-hydroxymyristoyl)glucosamine N-acyltransferase [Chlorobium sp.]MCF8286906.1 UDP-3-O-(3-hydroxymyristoyl)glucosamine N-acyltransferase [Chlorobium sp.]MCF8290502.1 UDP-3-O-(3-hydroxymyristoyl)glucosamine N-acyltrans
MLIREIRDYFGGFFGNVELHGSGDTFISAPAKIEEAQTGQVSFIANEKYLRFLASTTASLVIVGNQVSLDNVAPGTSVIRVGDPYTAFMLLLQKFSRPRHVAEPGIASTARIGRDVRMGNNVSIGEYVVVGDRCVIGDNTVIGHHSVLLRDVSVGSDTVINALISCYEGTVIGSRVIIHSGTVIGADGFGFAPQKDGSYLKIPQMGIVEIGDDTEIGANVTIDRATMGSTVIGKGVKIDNLVQIAHNCRIGDYTVIAAQAGISGSVTLGRFCMIGGQAGFAGHLELADRINVAAKAGISKSFSDQGISLRGYPAQPMREQLRLEALQRSLGSMKDRIGMLESEMAQLKTR